MKFPQVPGPNQATPACRRARWAWLTMLAVALAGADDAHAVLRGHTDVARLLLDRGAERDARDRPGWTPLLVAAERGHAPMVALLLEAGAAADTPDDMGRTPLMYAAYTGREAAARLLIEAGAQAHATDQTGNHVLHWAARGAALLAGIGAGLYADEWDAAAPAREKIHGR